MARTKGMLNLSGNLEVNAGAPLDARTVVPTVADLTIASNFQYKYIGMPVTVQATGDMYVLTANDVTDIANWKPVGKTYTAGTNVSISEQNVISATDTTYAAGDGIDITNSVISVDEMASADMSEVIDPLPSIPTRYHKYSTEEQVVGEWIDGKPIYEKTIIDSTENTSGNLDISIGTTVDVVVMCIIAKDDRIMLPFQYDTTQQPVVFYVSITRQYVRIHHTEPSGTDSNTLNGTYRVTIQYTKTTD